MSLSGANDSPEAGFDMGRVGVVGPPCNASCRRSKHLSRFVDLPHRVDGAGVLNLWTFLRTVVVQAIHSSNMTDPKQSLGNGGQPAK